MRDPFGREGLRGGVRDRARHLAEVVVERRGARPQRREPGRGGDRVPREGPRLVDRAVGGEVGHEVGASAEGRRREPSTHDLAEGEQVRRAGGVPARVGTPFAGLVAVPAGGAAPEAGHHLVADEQGAVLLGDPPQPLGEAGCRRDDPHVARRCLRDDGCDLVATRREDLLDRGEVVVRQDDRLARRARRDTGRVRQREGRDTRSGVREEGVDVAVVAAGELHDDAATRDAARQPERRHRGLGAAADESHLLDRLHARDDLLGEGDLVLARRAEAEPLGGGVGDCREDVRVGVAEDHRAPAADEVDVAVAVDVGEPRALRRGDEAGRAADAAEGPHR